jgi:hypothetical protein
MNSETRRFHSVAQKFLDESHALFPHEASALGLHQFDGELGENTPQVHRKYCRLLESTLREIESLPDIAFSGDDWLDRRGFLSLLRTQLHHHATLQRWRNNPQAHCDTAIESIFELVVRNTENLHKALSNIESRLGKIPAFLAAGAACLEKPVPLWSKLAIQSCDGAITFLESLEKTLAAISGDPSRTAKLFRDAISAFKNYARSVGNKSPGAKNGFSIGREGFEFLIREKLGLALSLPEAESLGRKLVEQLSHEQKSESAKFGKKRASEIIEQAAAQWNPAAGSLLAEYQTVTQEVRERFVQADLLTMPQNETLKILPVPEFLRHQFPTAAYHQPGPFDKKQTGIFWVNDLSLLQKSPEKKRAEIRQHFGLELTCAHEAYPGHHAQFVIQNRHRSKLRRLFHHAIFYEGWTLWCEQMCIDRGIYDAPHARLAQITDALWRANRIVIDCGLHGGSLDFKKACRVLMDGVGFTARRAEGDVNWYTAAPTVPMSYLIGRIELEKMHARLVTADGWPLKKFNDWILSHGAIPWSWIWQSALSPVASTH